jgi:hypothetical protein
MFCANILARQAVAACKSFSVAEVHAPVHAASGTVSGGGTAYDQLNAKASEYRKAHPELELTQEQAFSKIFVDPANRELARAERAANRPVA